MAVAAGNNPNERQRKGGTLPRTKPHTPSAPIKVVPHPHKAPGGLRHRAPNPTGEPLPMGERGSRPARLAKRLSLRAPMLMATLGASFVVFLLCFYVTAYAHVNAQRLELSRLRQNMRDAQKREIALKGELSRYHLSASSRAQEMGLVPAPPESVQVLTETPSGTSIK